MQLNESLQLYFDLLERPKIKKLLLEDKCKMVADKYILACILVYFRRANFKKSDYNITNFYLALYLAHELIEDVDDFKDDIIASYLGPQRQFMKCYVEKFLQNRFTLLQRLEYKANVCKELCESLMQAAPHWAWTRTRDQTHSGVFYKHIRCRQCCFG